MDHHSNQIAAASSEGPSTRATLNTSAARTDKRPSSRRTKPALSEAAAAAEGLKRSLAPTAR